MVSLAKFGSDLGAGGRGFVCKAKTSEGQTVAFKFYREEKHFQQERIAYEHLQELGLTSTYLPRYYGPAPQTRYKGYYSTGIAIEKVKGIHFNKRFKDMSDEELKSLEEKLLAALSNLHKNGICHGDIKGNNILVTGSQSPWGFVIIDFSDAITQKSTPDPTKWKIACRRDIGYTKELFENARSAKAVIAGCRLIQDTISALPSNTSDLEISNHFNEDLQVQLSKLLNSATSGYTDTLPTLVDQIFSTIKHPVPQLALRLARQLRILGKKDDALRIVEDCITTGLTESDATLIPSFDYEKALILNSGGPKHVALPYLKSALSGFERQFGPDHIITLGCRYSLALYHLRDDLRTAKTILVSIAEVIRGKKRKTNSEKRLLQQVGWNLKGASIQKISLEENEDTTLVEVAVDTEVKPSTGK